MGNKQSRIIGIFLLFTACTGIIISLAFTFITIQVSDLIQTSLESAISTIEVALLTTEEGLDVIDDTLVQAQESLVLIDESINNVSLSFEDVAAIVETTSKITGDDFSKIVGDARTSIDSAASSSVMIDNALSFLASIPLLNLDYRPDPPLHVGLENLSSNLAGLPATFDSLQVDLSQSASVLGSISEDLQLLSDDLILFDENLSQGRDVISQYKLMVQETQDSLSVAQQNISKWLTIMKVAFLSLFIWMLITQIVFASLGYQLSRQDQRVKVDLIGQNPDVNNDGTMSHNNNN
ncbi:MAG: hypothetical protein AAGU75_21340 [Bacillota bacterium]|jgi:hypothetical protein